MACPISYQEGVVHYFIQPLEFRSCSSVLYKRSFTGAPNLIELILCMREGTGFLLLKPKVLKIAHPIYHLYKHSHITAIKRADSDSSLNSY